MVAANKRLLNLVRQLAIRDELLAMRLRSRLIVPQAQSPRKSRTWPRGRIPYAMQPFWVGLFALSSSHDRAMSRWLRAGDRHRDPDDARQPPRWNGVCSAWALRVACNFPGTARL